MKELVPLLAVMERIAKEHDVPMSAGTSFVLQFCHSDTCACVLVAVGVMLTRVMAILSGTQLHHLQRHHPLGGSQEP